MGFESYFQKLIPLQQQAQAQSVQQQAGMPPQAQLEQARMLRTGSMQERMTALDAMKKTGMGGNGMPSYSGPWQGLEGLMRMMHAGRGFNSPETRAVPSGGIASLPRHFAYSSAPNQAMTNLGRVVK